MLLLRVFFLSLLSMIIACSPSISDTENSNKTEQSGEDIISSEKGSISQEPAVPREISLPISLGQALRCDKLANFAINNPEALGILNKEQARTIQLRAKSSAYAKGEEQKLTPREVDNQRNAVYLGYESAGNFRLLGPPPTKAENEEAERARNAKIASALPKLKAELIEICKPMFLN